MNCKFFIPSLIFILFSSLVSASSVDVIRNLPDAAAVDKEFIVLLDAIVDEQEPPTAYIVVENYPATTEVTDCGDCDVLDKEKREIKWTVFEMRSGLPGIGTIPASGKTLKYALKSETAGIKLFNGGVISTDDQKMRAIKGDFTITVSETNENCIPSWSCSDWNPTICPSDEIQTRTCTDSNKCNTQANKPAESKDCEYLSKPIEPVEQKTPSGFVLIKLMRYLSASYKIIVGLVVIAVLAIVIVFISRNRRQSRKTAFVRRKNVRLVFAD